MYPPYNARADSSFFISAFFLYWVVGPIPLRFCANKCSCKVRVFCHQLQLQKPSCRLHHVCWPVFFAINANICVSPSLNPSWSKHTAALERATMTIRYGFSVKLTTLFTAWRAASCQAGDVGLLRRLAHTKCRAMWAISYGKPMPRQLVFSVASIVYRGQQICDAALNASPETLYELTGYSLHDFQTNAPQALFIGRGEHEHLY